MESELKSMTGVMREPEEGIEPERDETQVRAASRRLDLGLERLTKQAKLLEERISPYLRNEVSLDSRPDQAREEPVPAARELERQADVVDRVGTQLAELRNRFEG